MPYEKLKGQLQDRQVKSGQAKALSQARLDLERQQKRHLFEQEQADVQHARRQALAAELEKRLANSSGQTPADGAKELTRLRAASQRYEASRTERRKKIQALQEQIQANRQQWATVQKEESRLEQLIAQGMHRLDTRSKQLMDAIKIAASNAFRQALKPFKKAYDNYRDDHDYFRQLTHSGGVLRWNGQSLPQCLSEIPRGRRRFVHQAQEGLEQGGRLQPQRGCGPAARKPVACDPLLPQPRWG